MPCLKLFRIKTRWSLLYTLCPIILNNVHSPPNALLCHQMLKNKFVSPKNFDPCDLFLGPQLFGPPKRSLGPLSNAKCKKRVCIYTGKRISTASMKIAHTAPARLRVFPAMSLSSLCLGQCLQFGTVQVNIEILYVFKLFFNPFLSNNFLFMKTKKPQEEEDNLDPAEDGEASKKAHCASNQTQLGFYRHLQIISISVSCCI